MARRVLEHLTPEDWNIGKQGSPVRGAPIEAPVGFRRVRYLQQIDDTINRPVLNRLSATAVGTAVTCTGANISTGIGVGGSTPMKPQRYGEFTVKAVVQFNINSAGPAFVFVYRTLGAIPANGSPVGGSDVIVGGVAFMGGPTTSGVNQSGSLSFLDTGLDVSKKYRYYLAVNGPNTNVLHIIAGSQLLVLERA